MSPRIRLEKLCLPALIAGICLLVSFAAGAAPAPVKSSGGKHCLWRVTNAKSTFYLLGSLHRLRDTDYPLPAVMEQAINQSQQFYFETDPDTDGNMMERLERAAKLPHGGEIKDKVHPKTWEYLRTGAQGGGHDWIHLKAWGIAVFLLDYPVHVRLSGAYGVENYVEKKARARNCSLHGLESLDTHIAVFGGMSDIESEAYLLQAIVYADHRDSEMREMIAAWKAGNTEKLAVMDDPVVREAPGLNARFLASRNARWVPVIENAIKSGKPTMIVAGAMHFSGPQSVIAMLKARGYQIEQL
ncbi:MAG TPA: TraB/GumN family protein [Chthoniobacterales bacterium]|nr:TraB/GumN family protein [Chthoniobacterales bacterium]